MKRLGIAGFGIALTIGALPAAAQTGSPSTPAGVEITPYVSFGSYPSSRVGAAIGFALTPNFSVESEVGYRHTPIDSLSASASLLYHLPITGRFRPYLAGGIGVEEYATASGSPDHGIAIQRRTAFAINAGGGLKVAVDDTWGIRTDARWFNGAGRDAGEHWRLYNGVTYRTAGR
jgi:opacity protein-like surface antigen